MPTTDQVVEEPRWWAGVRHENGRWYGVMRSGNSEERSKPYKTFYGARNWVNRRSAAQVKELEG